MMQALNGDKPEPRWKRAKAYKIVNRDRPPVMCMLLIAVLAALQGCCPVLTACRTQVGHHGTSEMGH